MNYGSGSAMIIGSSASQQFNLKKDGIKALAEQLKGSKTTSKVEANLNYQTQTNFTSVAGGSSIGSQSRFSNNPPLSQYLSVNHNRDFSLSNAFTKNPPVPLHLSPI